MEIRIVVVDHDSQRYNTIGDWQFSINRNYLEIAVSKMDNWKYEILVAFHELVESILCEAHGITTELVDEFDLEHLVGEPGESPLAPYHEEHMSAESLERQLAQMLGVDWTEYETKLNKLIMERYHGTEDRTERKFSKVDSGISSDSETHICSWPDRRNNESGD